MSLSFQVSFDADDPPALAGFWAVALGYVLQPPPDGFDSWPAFIESVGLPVDEVDNYSALVDPDGSGPRLFFQKVPEGKQAKNRVHLDVNVGAPDHDWARVSSHAEKLREAGGTVVEERTDEMSRWIVMLDPEGNEFCVQ
ncbi:MAG: VOC family protein [Geodermatophilaceae bacterium]|nr:VOC family protein [Geodermatophilaceae bacterium]